MPVHIDTSTLRELSVLASADPRSIRRVLHGERVRGMADTRIRRALAERGISAPLPARQADPSGDTGASP